MRSGSVAVVIAAAAFGLLPAVTADAAGTTPNVPCVIGASGAWGNVTNGVIIGGVCVPTQSAESPQPPDGSVSTSVTIDCGIPGNTENISSGRWNLKACGPDTIACTPGPSDDPKLPLHAFITRTTTTDPTGKHTVTDSALWCGRSQKPQPTLADLRQAALKLLPKPGIGLTGKGATLINIQTIMWLDTTSDRDLGTVTVVGEQVRIRAHLTAVAWNFGDGTSDTAPGPGKAYGHPDTCPTTTCDDFFGHTYTNRAGPTTITATPTWTAQYSIAAKPWAPITPGIPGATTQAHLVIKQAHSELVPAPSHP
jgi:hypothetical protein